jgi:O-antigen/teichoic acid export membrane protein
MVLASPLLTRLYSPDEFGVLAVYAGLLALFSVIASLRYQLAIPLPVRDEDAVSVVFLSLLCVIGTTFTISVTVYLFGEFLVTVLDVPLLSPYLWLLPTGVFFVGVYQVFNFWAVRKKKYQAIAGTRIKQSLATLAIQLIGFKFGAMSLVGGQAFGQCVGGYSLGRDAMLSPELKKISWAGIWKAAKRYRYLPYFSTWSGLFNTAGIQLPPLLFAALFGAGAAGFYALAHRVLAVPMSVVGEAVSKVFFSSATEAQRNGSLDTLVYSVHEKLAVLAMPPTVILFVAGPYLFVFVFGEPWGKAGEFARFMAPWLYFVFVASPISNLVSILEKERQGMIFQAVLVTLRIIAITVGALLGEIMLSVILFSAVSALSWACFLFWMSVTVGNSIEKIIVMTVKIFLISSVCVFPLWISINLKFMGSIWLYSFGVTVIAVIIYYIKTYKNYFQG